MASGKTHAANARAVIWLSVPVSAAIAWRVDPQAIAGVGGAVVGWLIEPDLDLHNVTTRSENRMYRISPVLGYAWEIFWYPLARAIPHGSPLSHLPPLCTAIRLAYACLVVCIIMRACGVSVDVAALRLDRWAYWGFGWWALQDFVHLAGDGFKARHWFKRRKKRR